MDIPDKRPMIQMGFLNHLFEDAIKGLPQQKGGEVLSVAREIVHELLNIGALYLQEPTGRYRETLLRG